MNILKKKLESQERDFKKNVNPRRFVKSSLFNETFVLRDISRDLDSFWSDEDNGFMVFWHSLCLFSESYNSINKNKLTAEGNYNEILLPLLEILGYGEVGNKGLDHFVASEQFKFQTTSGEKEITPPLLIVNKASDKDYLVNSKSRGDFLNRFKEKVSLSVVFDYYDSISDQEQGNFDVSKSFNKNDSDETAYLSLNQRAVEYLNVINNRQDYSIVTDGARWRLIHKDKTKEDRNIFYEFDLKYFLGLFEGSSTDSIEENSEFLNASKWFYWFFSSTGLSDQGLNFISTLESKSKKYASSIEEDMKMRFVHAVTICTNGFIRALPTVSRQVPNLDLIVKTSESLVFNLFFLRSCESKGVIPFHQGYKKVSLANIIDKLEHYNVNLNWSENSLHHEKLASIFNCKVKENGTELIEHIYFLFETIRDGDNGFGITGFIESVFSDNELTFFKANKLTNVEVVNLLQELMLHEVDGKIRQIPYNSFSPRQLGTMYESFLEYKPAKASRNLYYLRKTTKNKTTWQWVDKTKLPRRINLSKIYHVKKGNYYFSPDNSDRKSTGSYYTPHYIVEYVVANTLGPLVSKCKNDRDILNLKVCDFAMGSAHFLVEALSFLSKEYKRFTNEKVTDADILSSVLDSCIFGVDVNDRAVKLAKLSLWLSSASPGKKLEKLQNQLICDDSILCLDWSSTFSHSFDAVIGNPPYSRLQRQATSDRKIVENLKEMYSSCSTGSFDLYIPFVEKSIQIISETGKIGLIVPNTVLTVNYANGLRGILSKGKYVDRIVDFKQFLVFENASTYTCLMFLSKNSSEKIDYLQINDNKSFEKEIKTSGLIGDRRFFSSLRTIHPSTSSNWEMKSKSASGLVEKLNTATDSTIGESAYKIFQGFITGRDKVLILKVHNEDSKYYHCYSKFLDKVVKLEKGSCKYVFLGKDVHRYVTEKSGNVVIYPYEEKNGETVLIQHRAMRKKFPHCMEYLLACKKELESREKGKFRGQDFYQYSRPQSMDLFKLPKLVMRSFSSQGEVTFDESGQFCFTPNVYGLVLKNNSLDNLLYTITYLNSNLVWFLISLTSSGIRGGFYQYTTRYTSPLPLFSIEYMKKNYPSEVRNLINLSKKILKLKRSSRNKSEVVEMEQEIDHIFYKLFKLSDNEIEQIENSRYRPS